MRGGLILGAHEKDKIGFRELFAIMFITLGTKSTDMTTVFLFRDGSSAAWMIVIGSFLLVLPSLLLLSHVLKKFKNKNLLEVAELTLGKPAAFIIAAIFFVTIVQNVASDSRSYMTQLNTLNFPNTPLFFLTLCFLGVCMWGAKRGWEAIASTGWMIYPYLSISLVLLFFLMLKESVFGRIFPLFGTGEWEIAKASFKYTSLFAEPFLVALMYPFVKNHQAYTRGVFGGLSLTVLSMTLSYLSYLWMFDFTSIEYMSYPFNDAIRFIGLGKLIANLETFFVTVWLVGVFVKFTIYIYITCKIFGFLVRIEEFEHTIFPLTILIFILSTIPENNEMNVFIIREYSLVYYKYFLLSLPLLLWGGMKAKEVWAK